MRVMINARVLSHKKITGVERYTSGIVQTLCGMLDDVIIEQPKPGSRLKEHYWEQFTLPKLAAKAGVDILFCPANLAPIKTGKPYKQVLVLHSVSYTQFADAYSPIFRRYYSAIVPRAAQASSAVITVSESERQEILKCYPFLKNKIFAVQNGVDAIFSPGGERDGSILYVGSMSPSKNLHGLLKAFVLVHNKIPQKLVIVGSHSDQFQGISELNKLLEMIPPERINIVGQVNQPEKLREYYRRADFFVFPSFYESSGFPPVEAMACGTPVIASDIPALKERCGEAALFCKADDPDDIAKKIVRLAADNSMREKLAEMGKLRAEGYSWEETARQTLKVYRDALEARSV